MLKPNLSTVVEANAIISLRGKNAVVVGGTSGIGRGLAVRLAKSGANVTVIGRSVVRGEEVIKELSAAATPSSSTEAPPTFRFLRCNCFLLSAVANCVELLLEGSAPIDYLVQTQGMATIQGFTPSNEEGLDQKLALHVYSRAAFMRGLQPALSRSGDPRSLTILSAGVHSSYKNFAKDPELSLGSYSIKNAADAAGFYNDILVDSLSRENPDTTFMHAAPGFIATNWGTEMPAPIRWCVRGLQRLMGRSKEDCAEYMFYGLTNPEHRGGFRLITEFGTATAKVTSLHDDAKGQVYANICEVLDARHAVAQVKK